MPDAPQKIARLIDKASYSHDRYQVFSDCVAAMTLSISNAVDRAQYDRREKRYRTRPVSAPRRTRDGGSSPPRGHISERASFSVVNELESVATRIAEADPERAVGLYATFIAAC